MANPYYSCTFMRLWKAATLTTTTKVYWVTGAMATTVITARCLGPDGRGVMAAAASWVAMFVTFGHLSLASVVMYVLTGDDRERVAEVTGSLLAIIAVITVIAWAAVATAYVASNGGPHAWDSTNSWRQDTSWLAASPWS